MTFRKAVPMLALCMACCLTPVSAQASSPFHSLPSLGDILRLVELADANGDGELTLSEVQTVFPFCTSELFDKLDVNDDGVLSLSDIAVPPHQHRHRHRNVIGKILDLLAIADANGDGTLTLDEIQAVLPGFPEEAFELMDRNNDDLISLADLPWGPGPAGRIMALLDLADTNDDGQVTYDELSAVLPGLTSAQFDAMDLNGDGVLSRDDLPAPPPEDCITRITELLAEADSNDDGQLTIEEIRAVYPGFPDRAFEHLDRNDDGVISIDDLPGCLPCDPRELLLGLVRSADADNDGQVTFAELQAVIPDITLEQFDILDRNDDGVITHDDLPPFGPAPRARLIRIIQIADADGDGEVTFPELQTILPGLTQEQFDLLDRNGDDVISLEDMPEPPADPECRLIALLSEADADGDGEVTFAELLAVAPDLTQEVFDLLDRNGDGVISVEDLPERFCDPRNLLRTLMREADADSNGQITYDEALAALPELTQEQFDQLDTNDDGVLTLEDMPCSPLPLRDRIRQCLLRAFLRLDTNGDGVLDVDEIATVFPDAPAELLATLDTDGDWAVSREELFAALAQAADGHRLLRVDDIDADGHTNAIDIQIVITHALGYRNGVLLADLDGNGKADSLDIQKVIVGVLGFD